MKQLIIVSATLFLLFLTATGSRADAQTPSSDNHTAQEEIVGQAIWEKLQTKQLECKNLTEDNYDSLGEYFMGQMLASSSAERMGSSHEAMNNMMTQMMGEQGEKQMHIVMGKRLSGCQTDAQLPQGGAGFMPMMGSAFAPESFGETRKGGNPARVLSGAEGMGYGNWNTMMGGWGGFGILGWVSMLLFWILLILGIIALIRYIGVSGKRSREDRSSLDILKERYAKGEIRKKEFEEMKKVL